MGLHIWIHTYFVHFVDECRMSLSVLSSNNRLLCVIKALSYGLHHQRMDHGSFDRIAVPDFVGQSYTASTPWSTRVVVDASNIMRGSAYVSLVADRVAPVIKESSSVQASQSTVSKACGWMWTKLKKVMCCSKRENTEPENDTLAMLL